MLNNLSNLQSNIDYHFKDTNILIKSLKHPSYSNEHGDKNDNNQRLEFLGDAILELIISDELYNDFEDLDEGVLTKKRANIVCEDTLSNVALDIDLYKYILHSNGFREHDIKNNKNILCDALESLIAAIYIDGGLESAKKFVLDYIYTKHNDDLINYKSIIREYCNKEKIELEFRLLNEKGPAHKKEFEVCCVLDGKKFKSAIELSKKKAEQLASKIVIEELNIKE